MKNIGYHTRMANNNLQKVCAGSFGGELSLETVNRLVKSHFDVIVKTSGRPVFVDKQGREVSLYISVDPEVTTKGAAVMKAWREARKKAEAEACQRDEELKSELDSLMDGLSNEEIIKRLKGWQQ